MEAYGDTVGQCNDSTNGNVGVWTGTARSRPLAVGLSQETQYAVRMAFQRQKAKSPSRGQAFYIETMEREKRLELSTYTLARYRSTN
jgi:hypothetical protein